MNQQPVETTQLTVSVSSDMSDLTRKLRIIAKHFTALADELEAPDRIITFPGGGLTEQQVNYLQERIKNDIRNQKQPGAWRDGYALGRDDEAAGLPLRTYPPADDSRPPKPPGGEPFRPKRITAAQLSHMMKAAGIDPAGMQLAALANLTDHIDRLYREASEHERRPECEPETPPAHDPTSTTSATTEIRHQPSHTGQRNGFGFTPWPRA